MTDVLISRRSFVAHAALFGATWSWPRARFGQPNPPVLRIGVVALTTSATDPRMMGLTIGAEEATHAAALFGGTVELIPWSIDAPLTDLSAVIGNDDLARTTAASGRANGDGVPLFNVGCTADSLRGANCLRTTFHIAPSDAMKASAVAAAKNTGEAMAWDPSLVRFGADTLNRRFLERFNRPMTSDAWTAWMATKVIWESGLRMQSGEPAKLTEYLERTTTQFDGHKGLPLSFRSWDHQLRQPLYVIHGAEVIDVPAGTAPGEPSRDVLDRLGPTAASSTCRLQP